nr:DUF6705 family protein [uncultured Flavobacterium sp.]
MKNIILKITILIFLSLSYKGTSQTILVWGENNGNLPENFLSSGQYYYKDVHNYLDNFTGTWEYINGNDKFQIILTKVTNYHYVSNNINLNYYKDAIKIRYKKFENNILVYESPMPDIPMFRSKDGFILDGYLRDYGRITKTVYYPLTNMVRAQGGEPIYPHCRITKELTRHNQTPKIFFSLELIDVVNYDTETYTGQPTFSIPNNVVMTKVD